MSHVGVMFGHGLVYRTDGLFEYVKTRLWMVIPKHYKFFYKRACGYYLFGHHYVCLWCLNGWVFGGAKLGVNVIVLPLQSFE